MSDARVVSITIKVIVFLIIIYPIIKWFISKCISLIKYIFRPIVIYCKNNDKFWNKIFEENEGNMKTTKINSSSKKKKSKKNRNKVKSLIVIYIICALSGIIILFSDLFNFIKDMHGRNICNEIVSKINRTPFNSYLIVDNDYNIVSEYSSRYKGIKALDSQYGYTIKYSNEFDKNTEFCKIWIKSENISDRLYVLIIGNFYLADKYSARLEGTERSIEIKMKPNETVYLKFEYNHDEFKEADSVVFTSNNVYIPMTEIEYCIEQEKLYKEAKEIYNYEYNDFLSCNCNPDCVSNHTSSAYSAVQGFNICLHHNPKCDIFKNDETRNNCLLLRKLIPVCNKWLEKNDIYKEILTKNTRKKNKNSSKVNNLSKNKKYKIESKRHCKTFEECKTNYEKSEYCKCLEYKQAINNPNRILAPQPMECKEFCKYIAN